MYHGPEGAWTAPRRVEDLFELPGETEEARRHWRALVPRFEYLLDDLHRPSVAHLLLGRTAGRPYQQGRCAVLLQLPRQPLEGGDGGRLQVGLRGTWCSRGSGRGLGGV